jgi:hypothetical protein
MRLSYIVPAHNEEAILERNVERIVRRLVPFERADVLLVENGSVDATWRIAQGLTGRHGSVSIQAYQQPQAGLGHAFDRGLQELERQSIAEGGSEGPGSPHWIALSAADLPFAFTDLEQALPWMRQSEAPKPGPSQPTVLLGSKAHPDSDVPASTPRRAASFAYRQLRRTILGMDVRDCQGTIFVRAPVAYGIRPQVTARGYFYTTEFVYLAQQQGESMLELPVTLQPAERKSTVRLFQDGLRMGAQLVALRYRTRQARRE